ncbi:MAG: toll/interleukin-1 receptor domain-containing protein [Gammaproteobacteria bacterium]|nr:MAG: toll/interleukin-1 receptor domain-containing protein [Gammaproteobacteria bacterium]
MTEAYDVFISYAHADNKIPHGSAAEMGWIGTLAANLNTGPNVLEKRIFIDYQLKPGDEFSDTLIDKVTNSKLLVLFLSRNYAESTWCGKELKHFIQAHSANPEKPVDVFVVELFPYEQLTGLPENIRNIRKHNIHAKFWVQPIDGSVPILAGYPTPSDNDDKVRIHYWNSLNTLRTAIDERLAKKTVLPAINHTGAVVKTVTTKSDDHKAVTPCTILLADVTDDLEPKRNEIKLALEAEKFLVLPDGDCVGLSIEEFNSAFPRDLKRSELFVQLLSPTVGRKTKGYPAPLPQLQFQLAREASKPILQWCEQLPVSGQINDQAHAKLFETEFLRVTNLNNFKTEIIERLQAEKAKRSKAISASLQSSQSKLGKKVLFVDDLASTDDLSKTLRATIKQHRYDIRALPDEAPLGNNGIDIKEFLRPCLAGITIYTDKSKFLTAHSRLTFFLNQIAEADLPLLRWGVYLLDGDVAKVFGIDSEDVVPVYEQDLVSFLQGLTQ